MKNGQRTVATLATLSLTLGTLVSIPAAPAQAAPVTNPVQYVNTLIDMTTSATMAGPTLPNGSIYPSPETTSPENGGYRNGNPVVGFTQLNAQGTGGTQSYGNFLISPQTGTLNTANANHSSPLANETGSADYYSVDLTRYGIHAETTPARNAAIYRFTYPASSESSLLIDVGRKIGGGNAMKNGSVTIDPATGLVTGGGTFGSNWNPSDYQMYFALKLDKLPDELGIFDSNGTQPGVYTKSITSASQIGAYAKFATTADEVVHVKIAISFNSAAKAAQFLDEQIPGYDFNGVRTAAQAEWNNVLGKVELGSDTTDAQRAKFYTALFHANVQPRDRVSDIGVWDDYYTLWDSWKTLFPFQTLTRPDMVAANVNSFITRFNDHGYLAETFTSGKEFLSGQGGNEAENVIGDAYLKNLAGVDWEQAYQVAKGNSEVLRSPQYISLGYHASGDRAINNLQYASRIKPASATMGFAINDHALAVMAAGLGHTDDAALFAARAQNWKNIWNPDATSDGYYGFAQNRNADGSFTAADPTGGYNSHYYEARIWEGSYYPVYDVAGMVEKMGGKYTFVSRLENALNKGYIDYSNEPSFQTIWLFSTPEIKRPDLAAKWANTYLKKFPGNGYPGDEDNGAMSTMVMFLLSGFFPYSGTNNYYLHGARLPEVTYHLANGNDFKITGVNASDTNIYVQSATLNGQPLEESWITYEQIMAGADLEFVMGPTPSDWGKEPVDPNLRPTDVENLQADAAAALTGVAKLTWDAATDTIGISNYRIYRGTDEDFVPSESNVIAETAALTYSDNLGYATGPYFYKVVAVNAVGNTSLNPAHTHVVIPASVVPAKYAGSLMFGAIGRVNAQAADTEGAAAAFDANESTKWSARVTNGTEDLTEVNKYPLGTMWLEADLGKEASVTNWMVRGGKAESAAFVMPEFYLQVKMNDAWVDVSHVTGFADYDYTETLAAPVTGQVFRLLIPLSTTTDGNYNARVPEFHLFGSWVNQTTPTYSITVATPNGGNAVVTASKASAELGETITVDVSGLDDGMVVGSLAVTTQDGPEAVTRITSGVPTGVRRYTFTMPPLRTTVTANIIPDPGLPSDVANLAVDPAFADFGRVKLTWDPATHSEGIAKYLVYRGLSADFDADEDSLVGEPTDTEFVDSPGTGLYFYKVVAEAISGTQSENPALVWAVQQVSGDAVYGATSENIARGKTATANDYAAPASNPNAPELPSYTVDGLATTKWSARSTGVLDEFGNWWLEVDLGQVYAINRWKVLHAQAGGESATYNTYDFKLQAKVDGQWVDVDAVTGNTASTTDRFVQDFAAQVVRLYITQPVNPSVTSSISARIYEFELYSPAATSGDFAGSLTVGKTGSVSDTANSTSENWDKTIDQNTATKWSARCMSPGSPDKSDPAYPNGTMWLQIDLGTEYLVNRWYVVNESASANAQFLLQVKDSGGSWVTVDTYENPSKLVAPLINQTLPAPVSGRYFRLLIPIPASCNQTPDNARVREFHLFGPATTATSAISVEQPALWSDVVDVPTIAAMDAAVVIDIDTTALPAGHALGDVAVSAAGVPVAATELTQGVPDGHRQFSFTMPPTAAVVTVTADVSAVQSSLDALQAMVNTVNSLSGLSSVYTSASVSALQDALAAAEAL
ncbi:MAG: GH92 family glycosyl hydrolase, partial [Propionibacteriaceae bacterium]|nr:GH92 family glycosyl hydrolase [Propionibacteriaceae bacterium]